MLLPTHARKIIQSIKNKKDDTIQGLVQQRQARPVGRQLLDKLHPLRLFYKKKKKGGSALPV
jgi:hypothetical protein